jgi:putative MATE family efflux protein
MSPTEALTNAASRPQTVPGSRSATSPVHGTQAARTQQLLSASPFPLLLRLAAPNSIAFFIQACVSMTEVWYVGRLGRDSLAAMALAFPFLMLIQTMSGGAMGGAVSSTVARAIGAGQNGRANAVAWHAIAIAIAGALVFAGLYALLGPAVLARLGGDGAVLVQATRYLGIVFAAGASLWLHAILGAVFRGTGDMRFPALVLLAGACLQVPLSGALILGWWGAPALGLTGAALSVTAVASLATLASLIKLTRGTGPLRLRFAGLRFEAATFREILRVGLGSAPAPLLTVFTIVAVNGLVADSGPAALAGYGIGSRLEFLLIPLVFGIGAALTAMVGVNLGAGEFDRALRIAWMGSASAAAITGTIGGVLALFPDLWVGTFTTDPLIHAAGISYLRTVGPCYAFYGLGLSLYFASQGARAMFWPVFSTALRFAVAVGGSTIAVSMFGRGEGAIFACVAAGMVVSGAVTAAAIAAGAWGRGSPTTRCRST